MKAIRLLLLIFYACAVLSAGLWTVSAMDRFLHAMQVAAQPKGD